MAPKKPTVTSSSTRSARVKGGSKPVVTQGAARNRAARTTLGPAPKQRPMATGGTKGPLQGGTRTMVAATPRGITMSGDKQAAIKAGGQRPAPKPAFGPVPTGPSERTIRSMEAGPVKVKANLGQQSTLSSAGPRPPRPPAQKPAQTPTQRGQAAVQAAQVKRGAKAASERMGAIVKGAQAARNIINALKTGIRGGAFAAGIQAYNTRGGTISEMDPKLAKQIAAMKNKVGPKKVGPKKVGPKKVGPGKVGTVAQAFDKSFAAARKAGKSEFTFQGKRYNTKMK
jgi:hypothetical protein